ncbi:MAG: peptidylprolyl isomerase [Candidatus Competibacterales bacterium]
MLSVLAPLALFIILSIGSSLPASSQELTFGPRQSTQGDPLDTIVAVVNDDLITRMELKRALSLIRGQVRNPAGSLPDPSDLERQVLERLILHLLQQRAARENGIVVNEATVNDALIDIAGRNAMTLDELRGAVEADGLDFEDYRAEIRQEVVSMRLRQRVVDSQIQVSEGEVDNWLDTRPAGAGPSAYRIAQILVGVPEGSSPERRDQARQRARDLVAQLRGGADFKTLAIAHSDGRQALDGGDLGWREAGQLPTLFTEAVPRLGVGEVSDPIASPSGFHIGTVLETRGGDSAQQRVSRQRARETLFNRRVEEAWERWLRQLRAEAYVEVRL